jgi:hypothetical protein
MVTFCPRALYVPFQDVTEIRWESPYEKDPRFRVEVAAVSRRNENFIPPILTSTMGKPSQAVSGTSSAKLPPSAPATRNTNMRP